MKIIQVLKSKLKEKFPRQWFEYSCHVEEPVKITERPSIKGLDDFGNNVLSFFKEAIARELPLMKGEGDDKPVMRGKKITVSFIFLLFVLVAKCVLFSYKYQMFNCIKFVLTDRRIL